MAGKVDRFKVKKPNLNKSSDSADGNVTGVEIDEIGDSIETEPELEKTFEREKVSNVAPKPASSSKSAQKVATRNVREIANTRKNMIQAGYRIREEYIEALRLQSKKEERKIESVLDDILTDYFESDERGSKFLETAHQILQIRSSF